PADLRDSTYSDSSSLDNRSTFFGRPSITPSLARSSIATYRDDAVVNPMPAQTVLRGKANVVSVKSGNSGTPTSTPPQTTPADEIANPLNRSASGRKLNIVMPTSVDAIRPSSSNSSSSQQTLSSASYGKPTLLTVGGGKPKPKGRFPVSPDPSSTTLQTKPNVSSPLASSAATTPDEEIDASPFSDAASISPPVGTKRTPGGLSAVIEETASMRGSLAARRLSRQQQHQVPRGESPFGDEHEA
ncbi:hypothetical protein KCU67_g9026, partial [Aureobasidium melanogenum]